MSISYKAVPLKLASLINESTQDAIYLIPDLQRSYVWNPSQVKLLIDSLFRGWPFGSLLTWEIKPDCYEDGDGIPHRRFWQVVDRTFEKDGSQNPQMGQPSTYYMVLDGQQRIQSLVLALGGDDFGFKLYDHDWIADTKGLKPKQTDHWSHGSLCLDIDAFNQAMDAMDDDVNKIVIENILAWVVTSPYKQSKKSKPASYIEPLPRLWEHPGKYIRFSRLWKIAEGGVSELKYQTILPDFLEKQGLKVEKGDLLLPRMAALMRTVGEIKQNAHVQALQINSLEITSQWTRDDYNDAIVNIFTRLNTAGRTLTREEITLAWMKVNWKPQFIEGQKSAGECLNEIINLLEEGGMTISPDEAVRLLSFFWIVLKRDGELLNDRDLLKSNVIKPMAEDISQEWNNIIFTIEYSVKVSKDRDLFENSGSFNALLVAWCWLFLADRWGRMHNRQMRVRDDDDYCMKVVTQFEKFLDRWVFASQWANVWAVRATKNLQDFAKELSRCDEDLKTVANPDEAFSKLEYAIDGLMTKITDAAVSNIRNILVKDRSKVSNYKTALWVWHRLDASRWEKSQIVMRRGRERADFKPEVDHTIADAYWKRRVEDELARMASSGVDLSVPDGYPERGPGDFETRQEAEAFINTLGNCSLLKKKFNISKNAKSMKFFLDGVHEIKGGVFTIDEWEAALSMSRIFTEPEKASFNEMIKAIKDRDQQIRNELIEFINGRLERQDV